MIISFLSDFSLQCPGTVRYFPGNSQFTDNVGFDRKSTEIKMARIFSFLLTVFAHIFHKNILPEHVGRAVMI